jgi:hypothetical protein
MARREVSIFVESRKSKKQSGVVDDDEQNVSGLKIPLKFWVMGKA